VSAATELQQWRDRGQMVATPHGDVFVVDVPCAGTAVHAPILILHGFPSCSLDWRHVLDRFAAQRRVVAFDFLGFGLSSKPDRRYSIEMYADAAAAVVEASGLDRVDLVTHDMGDTVGGELLARDLDGTLGFAIRRRVLTNGSIYIDMAHLTDGQQLLLSLDDAPTDLISEPAFSGGLALTFSPEHPASREELAVQWAALSHNDGHRLLARTIRYIEDRRANEARYTGAIERHPSPVGVVWGMQDPVAVARMVDRFLAARPDAPFVALDDVGHYPMVEAPDEFGAAVLSLLDG
jgi:pimeloyl-ACP methyl ester carboxylesterase